MANNIKLKVNAGLQNTWGVFSLKGDPTNGTGGAYDSINVKITIDGDKYVENTEYSVIHAGESNYKESEAIDPILVDSEKNYGWELNQYGNDFKDIIKRYFVNNNITGVADQDLYSNEDAYKRYINQFKVLFPTYNNTYSNDEGLSYMDSKGNIKSLAGHKYVKEKLERLSGATIQQWLKFNVKIIHFSKYYNIYKPSNINIPALQPLIVTEEDLDKYNMATTSNGEPYIKTLANFVFWNEGSGHDGHTDLREWQYDDIKGYYDYGGTEVVSWDDEFYTRHHSDDGHGKGYSMFKSSIRPDVYRIIDVSTEKWPQVLSKGFSLLVLNGDRNVLDPMNTNDDNKDYESKILPSDFTKKYYQSAVTKYGFNNQLQDEKPQQLASLWYYDDDEGNLRFFNTWFFLNKKYAAKHLEQTFSFSSGYAPNYPKTVGLALASLLSSMYAYSGTDISGKAYISDCVYLTENTTSYTQDIIYDVSVASGVNHNSILRFNTVDYADYLDQVLQKVNPAAGLVNKNNVNATIRQCIKNCPLQMNMVYKEPNTENVGQEGNTTAVISITGNTEYINNWKPEANKLYQLQQNSEGEVQAVSLDEFFTIKYLSKLTKDTSGKLTGTYSGAQEINPNIYKMFGVEDNYLKFKVCKAYGSNSNYFSIPQKNDDDWYAIRDIPKSDILFPFGKIIYN